jgi:hypothetical protein
MQRKRQLDRNHREVAKLREKEISFTIENEERNKVKSRKDRQTERNKKIVVKKTFQQIACGAKNKKGCLLFFGK